ncbi:enoyl-CoA hydratase/isomerase family protein [Pseudopedobacter saltans]|nr:enoyl-CoA hydratase-related protein [Pseudopedobacter saltans]
MGYENLKIEKADNILLVTISREKQLNALNKQTIEELYELLIAEKENQTTSGVIITGAGEKSFVAGADINEFLNLDKGQAIALSERGHHVFNTIEDFPKPIIAAINGYALGGGLELALACHLRIASENARFGFPELNLGIIPGYGGTQRLPELIGKGRAMEMILTTQQITSNQALDYGLINDLVLKDQLLTAAKELIQKIISKSPEAVKSAIRAVNGNCRDKNGFKIEIDEFSKCCGTQNFREGVAAFLEKRPSKFQ